MNVVLSSKLSLNNVQLRALCEALNRESLAGAKVFFIIDAVPSGNSDDPKKDTNNSVADINTGDSKNGYPAWVEKDADKFRALGAEVISGRLSKDDWGSNKEKILNSDIFFFEGGSTPKLLNAIRNTELMRLVNSGLLEDKVWFGISAGGCVLSSKCYSSCEKWFAEGPTEEPIDGLTSEEGNFYFIPHYKSPDFPLNREENLKYVQEKLEDLKNLGKTPTAIIGTDNCVVPGILKNNIFTPNEGNLYDSFILN